MLSLPATVDASTHPGGFSCEGYPPRRNIDLQLQESNPFACTAQLGCFTCFAAVSCGSGGLDTGMDPGPAQPFLQRNGLNVEGVTPPSPPMPRGVHILN